MLFADAWERDPHFSMIEPESEKGRIETEVVHDVRTIND